MDPGRRRTDTVLEVFRELTEERGANGPVRPGDINERLKARQEPMGAWEVRGELSNLEAMGAVCMDEDTGDWYLIADAAQFQNTA